MEAYARTCDRQPYPGRIGYGDRAAGGQPPRGQPQGASPKGTSPQDEYELQIGVKRGKTGDDLVVKNRTGAIIYSYGKHAEELTDIDLEMCGAIPQKENPRMRCKSCGQFSVHINRGLGLCRDCTFQTLAVRGCAFGTPLDDLTRRSAF